MRTPVYFTIPELSRAVLSMDNVKMPPDQVELLNHLYEAGLKKIAICALGRDYVEIDLENGHVLQCSVQPNTSAKRQSL